MSSFDFNSVKKQSYANNTAFNIEIPIIEILREFLSLMFLLDSNDLDLKRNGYFIDVKIHKLRFLPKRPKFDEEKFKSLLKGCYNILNHVRINSTITINNYACQYENWIKALSRFNYIETIHIDDDFNDDMISAIRILNNAKSFYIFKNYDFSNYPQGLLKNKNLHIDYDIDIYEDNWNDKNFRSLLLDAKRIYSINIHDNIFLNSSDALRLLQDKCREIVFDLGVKIPENIPILADSIYFAPSVDDMMNKDYKFPNMKNCRDFITIYLRKALDDLYEKLKNLYLCRQVLCGFLKNLDNYTLNSKNRNYCILLTSELQRRLYFNSRLLYSIPIGSKNMNFNMNFIVDKDLEDYRSIWSIIDDKLID